MNAAGEARERLEAEVWRVLGEYSPCPRVHHVDRIIAMADQYRHAAAGEDDLAGRGPHPRVHWRGTLPPGGVACRRGSGHGLAVAADPERVTCAQCRRTGLWQDAHAGRGREGRLRDAEASAAGHYAATAGRTGKAAP